jgi:hypothetical protein
MLDTRCSMLDQPQTDRVFRIENLASLLLRPWMKLPMNSFEPLLIDMRVDLRGRNIGVAEHLLNNPQIGAVSEQVRRETMPEKVRVNVLLQSGPSCVFFHNLPDARCR